jgi:hypothetical protein
MHILDYLTDAEHNIRVDEDSVGDAVQQPGTTSMNSQSEAEPKHGRDN